MFDGVKVTIDGGLSVVATLEFFQHDLAEMGHRETSFLCTQTRSPTSRTAGSMTRDSVRRTSDLVQARFWPVGSEEARLRAGLRPPLKLHVRFSRMQLSRRHMT